MHCFGDGVFQLVIGCFYRALRGLLLVYFSQSLQTALPFFEMTLGY